MTEKKPKWARKRQIPKKLNKREKRILRPASGWELGLQWGAGDTRGQVTGEWWCHLPVWVWPHRDRAAQCSV